MKINLSDVQIIFPENPYQKWTEEGFDYEMYELAARLDDQRIGYVHIARLIGINEAGGEDLVIDPFWRNVPIKGRYMSPVEKMNLPRPVVTLRRTSDGIIDVIFTEEKQTLIYSEKDDFTRNGLQRLLSIKANEWAKSKWGTPIHSDVHFKRGTGEYAKMSWRSLEREGIAFCYSYEGQERWGMF